MTGWEVGGNAVVKRVLCGFQDDRRVLCGVFIHNNKWLGSGLRLIDFTAFCYCLISLCSGFGLFDVIVFWFLIVLISLCSGFGLFDSSVF